MSLERRARAYIAAIEGGATGEELAAFYHSDIVQDEYPNRLVPAGARRGLAEILRGAESARKLMSRLIFDVHTVTVVGDRVILEIGWMGYLDVPYGMLRAGDAVRARFVQVIEFEDGLIIRQRIYGCFEPF
ncbi:MAG: nuclear transport factor 2 family protein [Alphaproteobacteria bacterium]|nr:nuclear transport factor 2 family protein [Alphaproteobacteria bacterium]